MHLFYANYSLENGNVRRNICSMFVNIKFLSRSLCSKVFWSVPKINKLHVSGTFRNIFTTTPIHTYNATAAAVRIPTTTMSIYMYNIFSTRKPFLAKVLIMSFGYRPSFLFGSFPLCWNPISCIMTFKNVNLILYRWFYFGLRSGWVKQAHTLFRCRYNKWIGLFRTGLPHWQSD